MSSVILYYSMIFYVAAIMLKHFFNKFWIVMICYVDSHRVSTWFVNLAAHDFSGILFAV